MRKTIFSSAVLCFVLGVAGAAPTLKEKDAPEDNTPPTKEQAAKSVANLKQLGIGFHNYHDNHGSLPHNIMKDGKPILSWRVAILPDLNQKELYNQFKLDEPWDSEHNKKLIEKIPPLYLPVRGKAHQGETFYQSFAGKHAILAEQPVSLVAMTDGTSNTFMVAEGEKAVIWTKPDDIVFDGKLDGKERPKLGGMFKGHFHVCFGDGAVRFISSKIETDMLRALITRDGGEVFGNIPLSDLFKE